MSDLSAELVIFYNLRLEGLVFYSVIFIFSYFGDLSGGLEADLAIHAPAQRERICWGDGIPRRSLESRSRGPRPEIGCAGRPQGYALARQREALAFRPPPSRR